jgi:hypothetical protein
MTFKHVCFVFPLTHAPSRFSIANKHIFYRERTHICSSGASFDGDDARGSMILKHAYALSFFSHTSFYSCVSQNNKLIAPVPRSTATMRAAAAAAAAAAMTAPDVSNDGGGDGKNDGDGDGKDDGDGDGKDDGDGDGGGGEGNISALNKARDSQAPSSSALTIEMSEAAAAITGHRRSVSVRSSDGDGGGGIARSVQSRSLLAIIIQPANQNDHLNDAITCIPLFLCVPHLIGGSFILAFPL